jgi:hypothetical protein
MAEGFYKAVTEELSKRGYRYLKTSKHEVWVNSDGRKLTVPFNLKSRHTANAILKDAGSSVRV